MNDSFRHLCYATAWLSVGDVLSLLGWITHHACMSGAFHPLYRYGDTCTQCQRQYGWIKERPVEYKFLFTKHFSCAWFPFFFSSKFFGDRRDTPSLYDRDMCVKGISTIPPDFLRMLTSYQTRWSRELISIQFRFAFAWQVQLTNENLYKRESYISLKALLTVSRPW